MNGVQKAWIYGLFPPAPLVSSYNPVATGNFYYFQPTGH